MGRYIGPKSKIARKFGEAIYGADRSLEKKNYPPGQHGLMRKRKKVSEYGLQLRKLSMVYRRNSSVALLRRQLALAVSPVRTCFRFWSAVWTM